MSGTGKAGKRETRPVGCHGGGEAPLWDAPAPGPSRSSTHIKNEEGGLSGLEGAAQREAADPRARVSQAWVVRRSSTIGISLDVRTR